MSWDLPLTTTASLSPANCSAGSSSGMGHDWWLCAFLAGKGGREEEEEENVHVTTG